MKHAPVLTAVLLLTATVIGQKVPDLRLDGAGPNGVSTFPRLAAGHELHAAWLERWASSDVVLYNRSADGGRTWLGTPLRLDSKPLPTTWTASEVQLAAAGDRVYAVWHDHYGEVRGNCSVDGGRTWLATDLRIDHGTGMADYPRIAAVDDAVHVVWCDARNGVFAIYYNRSLDRGTTWLPADIRLDSGTVSSLSCEIAAAGSTVVVTWNDYQSSIASVHANRSLDAGASWLGSDIRLDVGAGNRAPGSLNPRVAISGSSVYAWWVDNRNVYPCIYFSRSLDSGSTWQAELPVNHPPGPYSALEPQLAADGADVCVVWNDMRHSPAASLYCNRSFDAGATWQPVDVRIDHGAANTVAGLRVRLVASMGALFTAWTDARNGGSDVYCSRSVDHGATWLPFDVRLATPPAGTVWANQVQLAASTTGVYALWQDDRNGATDVYFTIPLGFQLYGSATPGSGSRAPGLRAAGLPLMGTATSLAVEAGLPRTGGLLLFGVGPGSQTALPLFGGTVLVQPTSTLFFVLDGAGAASLPLTFPNTSAFLGWNVNLQAIFIDAGAPGGLSMTNGLETWIG